MRKLLEYYQVSAQVAALHYVLDTGDARESTHGKDICRILYMLEATKPLYRNIITQLFFLFLVPC